MTMRIRAAVALLLAATSLAALAPFAARAQISPNVTNADPLPPGKFELQPGEIERIVNLKHPAIYRVCNNPGTSPTINVYFDNDKDATLRQGHCHDYEASVIKVEATPADTFATGTYHLVRTLPWQPKP